jgi:hypothetical protein
MLDTSTAGLFLACSGELLTIVVESAPFFGARDLLSVSELSKSPKGTLKAGSFGEAASLADEAGGNAKIFSPALRARTPMEEAARLRKIRSPTPFFPEK